MCRAARRLAWCWAALAVACFDPTAPAAPCSAGRDHSCPAGQTCLRGTCVTGAPRPTGGASLTGAPHLPRLGLATATRLDDGRALIAGGLDASSAAIGSSGTSPSTGQTDVYDPASFSFAAGPAMGCTRAGATATKLADGRVLLAGGYGRPDPARAEAFLGCAELYTPATGGAGSFQRTGSLVWPRANATATLLGDGRVLIAGGANADGVVRAAELYDPEQGAFVPVTSGGNTSYTQDGRAFATATRLSNGKVLLAGGVDDAGQTLRSSEVFDKDTRKFAWTLGQPMHARALGTASIVPGSGTVVLLAGGFGADDLPTATAELYDQITDSFTNAGPLQEPRAGAIAATIDRLGATYVMLAGGKGSDGAPLSSAELFDPNAHHLYGPPWGFAPAGGLTRSRLGASAVVLGDGSALIVGGDPQSAPATAELYRLQ